MPFVDTLIPRYMTPKYTYHDLQEIAYYELVVTVKRAQASLKNNNIRAYIGRTVSMQLRKHVSADHLPIYRGRIPPSVTNIAERVDLDSLALATKDDTLDRLILWEQVERAITSDEQRIVVKMRLQGYCNREIAKHIGGNMMRVQRYWASFIERVRQ